jgi:hypothetical protein
MFKRILFLLIFSFSTSIFGQVSFEPGYIIFNDGSRLDCQIKNMDWLNNPKRISYLIPEGNTPITIGIKDIREFGINEVCRYFRKVVQVDVSGNDLPFLTTDKNPVFRTMTLFLRVLVQGEASLFYYQDQNIKRFFYSVSDTTLTPMVYKRYLAKNGDIATNSTFRQQLWTNVRYPGQTLNSVRELDYDRKSLEKYFIVYNQEKYTLVNEFTASETKSKFNLRITPGIVHSTLILNRQYYDTHNWFNPVTSFRIGLEAEYIMPFNKNRMSVVFEPTFQHLITSDENVSIDYPFIEYPIGIRYYKFCRNSAKIFINAFYNTCFSTNFGSKIQYYDSHIDVFTGNSLAVGAGFDYKRISIEARYYSTRDLCSIGSPDFDSKFKRVCIVMGLKLF